MLEDQRRPQLAYVVPKPPRASDEGTASACAGVSASLSSSPSDNAGARLGARKLNERSGGTKEERERKPLLVRLVLTNNSDSSWRASTRAGRRSPWPTARRLVLAVSGARPTARTPFDIPARGRETFDLAFDVPPTGHPLDHVELAWQVNLRDVVANNRTDVRREEVGREQRPELQQGVNARPDLVEVRGRSSHRHVGTTR